ncbi:MAG: Hsp20/alpha crystallin family protein [Candidatus Heimdallarchaeota archaeon]
MANKENDLDVQRTNKPKAIVQWQNSPWSWMSDFNSLLTNFRRSIDDFFWGKPLDRFNTIPRTAVIDVIQKDKGYIIRAELPGLDKKDINIEVDGQYLTIRGERKSEEEEKGEGYIRQERAYGTFIRQIVLPQDVMTDQEIKAKLEKGILEIQIPREPKEPKKAIKIE